MVILIFLGLAVSPSINANVSKQDDLVELDVDFCGLGRKHNVKLTQEEYNEVELLFENIEKRLSLVDSDDEAVKIFNDAIVKLDDYGLLGGLSVRQVQRLITYRYKFLKNNQLNPENVFLENSDNDVNYLCLISGRINFFIEQGFLLRSLQMFLQVLNLQDLFKYNLFMSLFCSIKYILLPFSIMSTKGFTSEISAGPFGDIISYTEGTVSSFGKLGYVNWTGKLIGSASPFPMYSSLIIVASIYLYLASRYSYPAVLGFTGISIEGLNPSFPAPCFFLGFACKAQMKAE